MTRENPSTMRLAKEGLGALLPALLVSACMVGPLYKKPAVTVPDVFRSQISASDSTSFADLPWWNVFNDEALRALITEALANNNDLQVAVAKIEQARAMVAGTLFPRGG